MIPVSSFCESSLLPPYRAKHLAAVQSDRDLRSHLLVQRERALRDRRALVELPFHEGPHCSDHLGVGQVARLPQGPCELLDAQGLDVRRRNVALLEQVVEPRLACVKLSLPVSGLRHEAKDSGGVGEPLRCIARA